MAHEISRRQFLRGDIQDRYAPIRPPWALGETDFVARCDRCGDCIDACHENVLKAGSGRYPEVDFSMDACAFCGDCVRACTRGALGPDTEQPPWMLSLAIHDNCLARNGTECRVCGEQCEFAAIRFIPVLRSVPRPHLEAGQCTGCGACVGPCPAGAISLSANNSEGKQQR